MDSEFKNFSIEKNALKVPFGKYKDHEITDLLADTNYIEWLAQQSWIKEKYLVIFQVIQQYNFEDQPTLEHNAMQMKWLENNYIKKFLKNYLSHLSSKTSFKFYDPQFEKLGFDVILMVDIINEYEEDFENEISHTYAILLIELKPLIGDDYPAILRKMNKQITNYSDLFIPGDFRKHFDYAKNMNGIPLKQFIFKILIANKIVTSNDIKIEKIKQFFKANNIILYIESEFEENE